MLILSFHYRRDRLALRASIDLEGKRVWSWALRSPNVRDQVEEGNTVRENEE